VTSSEGLEKLARRAYERGRLQWAIRRGVFLPLVATLGLVGCNHRALSLGCIVLLTFGVTFFLYRGGDLARGARLGLAAGIAPFLCPVGARALGVYCDASSLCTSIPVFCVLGGIIGGMVLGLRGSPPTAHPHGFWFSAASVAVTAGSAGCLLAGLAGPAGLALGLLLGFGPALLFRSA